MVFAMETLTKAAKSDPARAERPPLDLEQECETWDWVRAAGISGHELRKALREMLRSPQDL
jgi:hypothetical protein